jgi:hypothetical protein
MISRNIILQPSNELLPDYKICPFTTEYLSKNRHLPSSELIDEYLIKRFRDSRFAYTNNGRHAINQALSYYNLKKDDCVTIFTTSGNFYISSCVTTEIEKFCSWSRKIEINTRVILVNHEFGFPYNDLNGLLQFNIPIIEDCAHSFFSHDINDTTGRVGDFAIYSFPKMFPVQVGGLLVSNKNIPIKDSAGVEMLRYLKNVISFYVSDFENIITVRKENYNYLKSLFDRLNFKERFSLCSNIVPGVFLFTTAEIDLQGLKRYYYSHGVQCSVFYGEDAFFLPVHQNLNRDDIDYFYEIIKSYINLS